MKVLLISILFSFSASAGTTLGKGAKGDLTHQLTQLTKSKKDLEGQFVRVKGTVKDVCPMKGCWVQLEDIKTGARIKVKVKDDVIVFPAAVKGKEIQVQGKLIAKRMSHKKAIQYYRHLAEEKSQKFDPKSISGPMVIYQINATGAEI